MRVVVQKCKDAKVTSNGKVYGEVPFGLMLLVGFTEGDNLSTIEWMAKKISNLRIFEDENDVMNLSILDMKGSCLSISQFTLYADCIKGNRPSYIKSLRKEEADKLYQIFNEELRKYLPVETGNFGEEMEVSFTNLGPTTILLER